MLAYHFVRNNKLRDGTPIPSDGEKLVYSGDLILCCYGLHASVKILDALRYAPGFTLCRVECGGKIIEGRDKIVCSERTILWRKDIRGILLSFARECASDVLHLWDAPESVKSFLATGEDASVAVAASRDAATTAGYAADDAYAATAAGYAAAIASTTTDVAARAAARAAHSAARATAHSSAATWDETYNATMARYETRLKTLIGK